MHSGPPSARLVPQRHQHDVRAPQLGLIPCCYCISLSPSVTLSPSLMSLKGRERGGDTATVSPSIPIAREMREFPPLKAFNPHSHYPAHLTFIHHLYVYPHSLKYDSQKSFAKVSSCVCCHCCSSTNELTNLHVRLVYHTGP